jgi:hypothetical protein
MHKHDLDLIAALAEGSLDDETEARALLESCEECQAEYRSQLEILTILSSAPPAEMTELEKAALHRDLWTELRNPSTNAPTGPAWYRWSYVAAGLFVIVGLVGVLSGQLGLGSGDSAESGEITETTSDLATFSADEGSEAPLLDAAPAADGADAESAPTTTMAAEEAGPLPYAEFAEQARIARESSQRSAPTLSSKEDIDHCLEEAGLTDVKVVEELVLDQRYLLVMPLDETSEQTVTFIAMETCEIVYVDE